MNLAKELAERPYGAKARAIAAYIGNDRDRFAELVALVLEEDEKVAQYASWLINHCMQAYPQLIEPHLDALIQNLDKPRLSNSVIRSTVKALAEADIPPALQGYALNHCFDYLLDPQRPVAVQVHAMQTIFNISKDQPDLLRELQLVIEEGMPQATAGYKARGRRILREIVKILGG